MERFRGTKQGKGDKVPKGKPTMPAGKKNKGGY